MQNITGNNAIGSTRSLIKFDADIARVIDHTLLKPDAGPADFENLCRQAIDFNFATVCVLPVNVSRCVEYLRDSSIPVGTTVGFPFGANETSIKVAEAALAVERGATELDMVMNLTALKSGDYDFVEKDIRSVVDAAAGNILKVIIEAALLTDEEKIQAAMLVKSAGAQFVKTSTGFNGSYATSDDVALLRRVVGPDFGVKAAGGIRTRENALSMLHAGANRIGASAGLNIIGAANLD